MVPVIGSGRFITAPIINDDRQMIEDSSTDSNFQDDNGVMATSLIDSSLDHGRHVSNAVSEKKVIQWKLNLHQIGMYSHFIGSFATELIIFFCLNSIKVAKNFLFTHNVEVSSLIGQFQVLV